MWRIRSHLPRRVKRQIADDFRCLMSRALKDSRHVMSSGKAFSAKASFAAAPDLISRYENREGLCKLDSASWKLIYF